MDGGVDWYRVLQTYPIEVVGFLTGICLGALGCKKSKEPTPMTKEEALAVAEAASESS
jgi:hypothetical protein